jgi:uncharacterized damage-inducible protein DinB
MLHSDIERQLTMIDNRSEPPIAGTEKDILIGFLNFLRDTIVFKMEGLTDEEVRRPHQTSGLTLLGMMKHLAYVERSWFQRTFLGEEIDVPFTEDDPDADWRIEPNESTQDIIDLYRQEIAISNRVIANHGLNEVIRSFHRPEREGMQLRWIVTHLIEETARHCGHADLMREAIDGQVGE